MTEAPYYYASKPTWKVKWNGETIVAPSAYDILATIGERSYNPQDHKHPKRGIAYRVFVQYQIMIDDELPDEVFLSKLAEFGIIKLTVGGVRPPDVLQQSWEFISAWHNSPDTDFSEGGE
jgi:hypothetical protein